MSKTALITGGSSGLGFALAEQLGKEGYQILILARNQERIDKAVEDFRFVLDGFAKVPAPGLIERHAIVRRIISVLTRAAPALLRLFNRPIPADKPFAELKAGARRESVAELFPSGRSPAAQSARAAARPNGPTRCNSGSPKCRPRCAMPDRAD